MRNVDFALKVPLLKFLARTLLRISLWIWGFDCFAIFHKCMKNAIHLYGNIIHFIHEMKPLQNFCNIHFWC